MVIGTMLVFVLIAIALFAFAVFYRSQNPPKDRADTPATPPEPDPLQDLLALNLEVRKAAIARDLTGQCEAIIDKLVAVIPQVKQEDDPAGELAWTVNRIATEYLPNKCIRPYLAMKPADRESPEQIEDLEHSLAILAQELDEVAAMLSRRNREEFASKAKFLQHRFTSTGEA